MAESEDKSLSAQMTTALYAIKHLVEENVEIRNELAKLRAAVKRAAPPTAWEVKD